MAYEYRLSPIDIEGGIKAIQDNAYRAQVLAMKQEDARQKSIDNQYKIYSGKLRKQDIAKFDMYWADYTESLKDYQRLNRGLGNSSQIMTSSQKVQEKKNAVLNFIDRSTQYGALQNTIGKLYKDGGKLMDKKKFDEVYNSFSYDADELDNMYGGIDKFPKNFEVDINDLDQNKFATAMGRVAKIGNINTSTRKPKSKIDPNTNQLVTKPINIEGVGTLNIPIVEIQLGLSPSETLNATWNVTAPNSDFENAPAIYEKSLNADLQSSNPVIKQQAEERLKDIMTVYNIKDPSQVDGRYIIAHSWWKQGGGTVEVEDWSQFKTIESVIRGRASLNLSKQRLALAKKSFSDAKNNAALAQAQKLLNFGKTFMESGFVYDADWNAWGNNILNNTGLSLDQTMVEGMKKVQGVSKVNVAEGVAKEKANQPKGKDVPKP